MTVKSNIKIVGGNNIYDEIRKMYDKNKSISAEQVLQESKDPNHPLHKYFEWDDEIAGNKYRLIQARNLIKSIILEITNADNKKFNVRGFLSVSEGEDSALLIHGNQLTENYFVSIDDIENSQKLIEYQKLKAKSELKAFKIKYSVLENWLGKIFFEIDNL